MRHVLNNHALGSLSVWADPQKGVKYVVGADIATGKIRDIGQIRKDKAAMIKVLSEEPDYSCAIVVEQESGTHVASWHGQQTITTFAETCAAVALMYNQALLIPERNAVGEGVIDSLHRVIKYPNLYVSKLWNVTNLDQMSTRYGWYTNDASRAFLIQRIEEWLMIGGKTWDKQLVSELRTMQRDEAGVPRARGRNKDDRVLALALALQGRYEQNFGSLGARDPSLVPNIPKYDRDIWDRVLNDRNSSSSSPGASRRPVIRRRFLGRPGRH